MTKDGPIKEEKKEEKPPLAASEIGVLEAIQNSEKKAIASNTIKNFLKGAKYRKRFKQTQTHTIILQSIFRTITAQRELAKKKKSVIIIQSLYRSFKANKAKTLVLKRMTSRKNIIIELLTTEKTYVEQLETLQKIFFEEANPLPKDAIPVIFSNLPFLAQVHRSFLNEMNQRAKSWVDYHFRFADILLKYMQDFSGCIQFINNFDKSINALKKVSQDEKVAKFFSTIPSRFNHLDLADLLITPVQRIPRYELMLNDLRNQTLEEEPDYKAIVQSSEEIKKLNAEINQRKKESDSLEKIQYFDSKLVGNKGKLGYTKGRYFIREGQIRVLAKVQGTAPPTVAPTAQASSSSRETKKKPLQRGASNKRNTTSEKFIRKGEAMFWILFNDTLIWSEPKEKKKNLLSSTLRFEALKELPTRLIRVIPEIPQSDMQHISLMEEFNVSFMFKLEVISTGASYILRTESLLEKNHWVKSLKEAIDTNHH